MEWNPLGKFDVRQLIVVSIIAIKELLFQISHAGNITIINK